MTHTKIQGRQIKTVVATGTEKTGATTTVTVIEVGQIRSNAAVITFRCAPQKEMKKGRIRKPVRMMNQPVVVGLDKDRMIVNEVEQIATQEIEVTKMAAKIQSMEESKTRALSGEVLEKSRLLLTQTGFQ